MQLFRALVLFTPALASAQQIPAPTQERFELHSAPQTPSFGEALHNDAVPLPNAAYVVPERDGDRELAPAGGNPDFLGFTAGPYYPPADERIDPLLLEQLRSTHVDGRPSEHTYAFVMFSKRITDARRAELEAAGARIIEFHPHYALKIALTPDRLGEIAALDFVRWVGAPRPWQKLHPALTPTFDALRDGELASVFINVYDSDLGPDSRATTIARASLLGADRIPIDVEGYDAVTWMSNGWQQRVLAELGVEVVEYVDSIRAFRARIAPTSIEQLVELDFVQFIEPDAPNELHAWHDQSMPMINADVIRNQFNGAWNQYAVVGWADSGFYFQHPDLLHSLGLGWDFTTNNNPWEDPCGHGTHVSGTILGSGNVTDENAGVAPGLGTWAGGYFFNTRIFGGACSGSFSLSSVMNVMNTPFTFNNITTPKPHAQNHSWGSIALGQWNGTEADARLLDGEVYTHGQLMCFSAGNGGPGAQTLTLQASAKNVLTVGSVRDTELVVGAAPGDISAFSSRGPTTDGRWKPNLCAVGERVTSLQSGSTGYTDKNGTSMAAPHVAGVAEQIVDAKTTQVAYRADLLAALLMGSSVQRNNTVIGWELDAHLQNFGTGRIDARRAIQNTPQWNVQSWSFNQGGSNAFADFSVPVGTTRMVVCMRYHEPAASSGASQALVNDFDLYLDFAPFTTTGTASGDYWAHASPVDNTEFRVIDSPSSGSWRWKNWPTSVNQTCRVSVTVATMTGDITPAGALTVLTSDTTVRPNEAVDINAYYTVPTHQAASVMLDTTSSGNVLLLAETHLHDTRVANMLDNEFAGRDMTIGNVPIGIARRTQWSMYWPSEGIKTFRIDARSENADATSNVQTIYVDGTGPVGPSSPVSPTHAPGVVQCSTAVTLNWTPAADAISGVAGYVALLDSSATTNPTTATPSVTTLASNATSWSTVFGAGVNGYWLHVRAFDATGNYGATMHYGPIYGSGTGVSSYCTGKTNSLGCVPTVSSTGTPKIVGGNLTVRCANALNQKNGLMFWGLGSQATPFQGGTMCVQAPTVRTPAVSSGGSSSGNNCTGSYAFTFSQSYIQSVGLTPGDVVHTQFWMRDPASASTTGLSNALRFTLCQ